MTAAESRVCPVCDQHVREGELSVADGRIHHGCARRDVRQWARQTRIAQGLPPKITDPTTVDMIAAAVLAAIPIPQERAA